MTRIRKPGFHAGKVIVAALHDKIGAQAVEITRIRAALATAEKERDAAHNEALERAAHVVTDFDNAEWVCWGENRNAQIAEAVSEQIAATIRKLKKETPNADK